MVGEMITEPERGWRRWFVDRRYVVRLPDRSYITLLPKPAGYPVAESLARVAIPFDISILYDSVRYLRYRIESKGAWVIYVLRGDVSQGGLREAEVVRTVSARNRKMAKERVYEVGEALESVGLEALQRYPD